MSQSKAIAIKGIQAIKEESNEEQVKNDVHTLFTSYVGELFIIRRALHAKEVLLKPNQREQIFNNRYIVRGKVYELIINGRSCTNVASIKPH